MATGPPVARPDVSAREAEVLALVGERLSNAEIAARLYISVRTVESHVSALLHKLGVADRRQLGELAAGAAPGAGAAEPPGLPSPTTSLVGRSAERDDVEEALSESRLVTICGPGGCGKTRLALDVAHRGAADGPVWFAELAPVQDDRLLRGAVAAALAVIDDPVAGRTIEGYLRHRRGVLVLDNCEHLLAACSALVRDLLRTCPGVRVLATSREPLAVDGERVVRIAGLSDDDGVTLLLARALAAGTHVDEGRDGLPARRIVAAVGGLPLSIELAAARAATLTLKEIEGRLADQLGLLVAAGPDDDRHRSVRSTIAWSCDLLDPAEREALAQLAVFAGPFDLDGASRVLDGDALQAVDALVRRSLLGRDTDVAGSARYRMLEPVRQFARQLSDEPRLPLVRDRHLAYHVRLAEQARRGLRTGESATWMARLRASVDDIRVAVAHAFDVDPLAAGRLVADLTWPWFVDGNLVDLRAWTERALAAGGHEPQVAGWLEYGRAGVAVTHGDYDTAAAATANQLALGRETSDTELVSTALARHGLVAWAGGRTREAVGHYAAALDATRRTGDAWLLATRLALAARASSADGDDVTAGELLEEAMRVADHLGEPFAVGLVCDVAATGALVAADPGAAEDLAARSLAAYRAIGYREGITSALAVLGRAALEGDDLDRAELCFAEGLEQCLRLGHRSGTASALECLAAVAVRRGDHVGAAGALACADHIRGEIGAPVAPDRTAAIDRLVADVRTGLGERFDECWRRGTGLAPERAGEALAWNGRGSMATAVSE